jgi:hypothetical protein
VADSVIHADPVAFATAWFRTALAARPEPITDGVEVGDVEPETLTGPMLVIRDDSGPTTSLVTAERQLGLSVLCEMKADAIALGLIVHALVPSMPAVAAGNPVAAVLEQNGPYLVREDQPGYRTYQTATLAVVGVPFA